MQSIKLALRTMHLGLSENFFYPVILSTTMVLAFYLGRIYLSGSTLFLFLMQNLVLAWIPYLAGISFVLLAGRGRIWRLLSLPPFLIWFLFLPNAFYIITDLIHLSPGQGVPLWYDAGFIAFTAWAGLLLAVTSLYRVQQVVERQTNRWIAGLFSGMMLALSGYGVYLGRFQRWNSWDLWVRPLEVAKASLLPFVYARAYADKIGFIILFTCLFSVIYLAFV